MEARRQGRILVIRGGAIGDFVLTLPVLAALRSRFPGVCLGVLGYPGIAPLAQLGGLVDEVKSIEARALAGFFVPDGDLDPALAAYFGSCEVIVSFLFDPDGYFQANVVRCSSAQFLVGPHRPDEAKEIPATEVFLQPLERLAIYGADPEPRLLVDRAGAEGTGNEVWLAAHPGSGSPRKNWAESRWAGLLSRLGQHTEWHLLLVGGEAEGDRLDRLARLWPPERLELARSLPLPLLAGRLARCQAFLGHDSGITHLAAAVGLPGVVLWGDSKERIWRPPSPRMTVLREPGGLERLGADRVVTELTSVLGLGRIPD